MAVAAALPWHGRHADARQAIRPGVTPIVAHVALETYSVLTRLPSPGRVPAAAAQAFLAGVFTWPPLSLPSNNYATLLRRLSESGIAGGAVYDALIAATAAAAGASLVSLDRRAARTYRALGVAHRLLA